MTHDGRVVLGTDRTIEVWKVSPDRVELLETLVGHEDWVRGVAIDEDGNLLVSGSLDNTARIWDLRSGRLLHILDGHDDWIYDVAFSPDGRTVATASNDMSVRLWNVATGGELLALRHKGHVYSVRFSPDGRTLAAGTNEHATYLWSVNEAVKRDD
jgi:WD40 repeat protein